MADITTENESAPQHFFMLLKKFDVVMMLTGSGEAQQARPMTIVQIDSQGTAWFLSSLNAERTRDLEQSPRVRLLCQSMSVYLSLVGRAAVVKDQSKINELWKDSFKVWFPEGRTAPDLALISVTPISGEYWDQSGAKGLKYLFEAARAYLTGDEVKPDPKTHGSTLLDERPAPENRKGVR